MTARDTSHVPRSRSAVIVLWVAQIAVVSLVLLTGSSKLARLVVLMMLTGFKTRVSVLFNWTIAFLGRGRAQQAITAQQVFARRALEEHARESDTALPIPMTARRDGATP
jgi:hypothetical protein